MSGWPGHTRPHWNFFLKKEGGDGRKNKGVELGGKGDEGDKGDKGGEGGEEGEGGEGGEGDNKLSGQDIIFDILVPSAYKKYSIC